MMHAVCIEDRGGAEKDTVSRDSTIERKIKAGLLHHWNIKKIFMSRQFHTSTMPCLLQILLGNFDTQVLKAKEEGKPLPQGADYQHGERYGIATLREAVFARDGYKCQCCGRTIKDGVILHVHHVKYRSQGGTNSMSNLATVCDKCHTPKNHKPGGKLYNWKPKLSSFKGATFMTTIRWQLYNEIKTLFPDINIHITYGAATKERRQELNTCQ